MLANPSDWPEALKGEWFLGYEYAVEVARGRDLQALFENEVAKLRKEWGHEG